MCKPQIDARRAENASTSATVLLSTSQQPVPPARKQRTSSKKAAGSSGWCGQQKGTLVNERDDPRHYLCNKAQTFMHLLQCRFQNSKSSCPAQQS
jgi:hypothetical protein